MSSSSNTNDLNDLLRKVVFEEKMPEQREEKSEKKKGTEKPRLLGAKPKKMNTVQEEKKVSAPPQKVESVVQQHVEQRKGKEQIFVPKEKQVEITAVQSHVETHENAPVIKERIFPVEKEIVQPVLHREVQAKEIHLVEQPILETNVAEEQVVEKTLPSQVKPDIHIGRTKVELPRAEGRVEMAEKEVIREVKPVHVEETVRRTIVEEIQPIIYRETIAPTIIKETLPIYETVVEEPTIIREVREPIIRQELKEKPEFLKEVSRKETLQQQPQSM